LLAGLALAASTQAQPAAPDQPIAGTQTAALPPSDAAPANPALNLPEVTVVPPPPYAPGNGPRPSGGTAFPRITSASRPVTAAMSRCIPIRAASARAPARGTAFPLITSSPGLITTARSRCIPTRAASVLARKEGSAPPARRHTAGWSSRRVTNDQPSRGEPTKRRWRAMPSSDPLGPVARKLLTAETSWL